MKNLDLVIAGNCTITGQPYSVTVNSNDYLNWRNGELAQRAFPYLNAGDREWIITRISPTGWDILFPEERQVEA